MLVIMKATDVISGPKKQIRINRKDNFEDLKGVSFSGNNYDEKRVNKIVGLMSIEDPNIADILKPMN